MDILCASALPLSSVFELEMPAELITRYEDEYLRLVDHVRASFEHPADDTHIEEDLSSAERLVSPTDCVSDRLA